MFTRLLIRSSLIAVPLFVGLLVATTGVSSAQEQILFVTLDELRSKPLSIPVSEILEPEVVTITILRAQWPLQGVVRFFETRDPRTGTLSEFSDVTVFRNDGPNAVIRFDSSIVITTTLAHPDFLFPFFENPASVNKAGQFGVRALVPITERDASGNALGVRTITVKVFSGAVDDTESDRLTVSIAQREVDQPEARVITAAQPLLVNGDFELGNTGFSTDYIYSPGDVTPEGTYTVDTNPLANHPLFSPCGDHTTGTGNMMIVNGSVQPNRIVWSETVTVLPNRTYDFSGWATSVFPEAS